MSDKRTAGKYVEDGEIVIELRDRDLGVTFQDGTSPPRIQRMDIFSYFAGMLLVGDEILQIDKRLIRTVKDINEATQLSGNEPRTIRVRFRRDNYYQMRVIKVAAIRRRPNQHVICLQIRWRADQTVGIIVEKKVDNIVAMSVEPNSVAAMHIRAGDIILEVNDRRVTEISETKRAIRQSITERNSVKLKLERDVSPPKKIADPADDVRTILSRNAGFWHRTCRLRAIDEDGAKARRVYHVPDVESEHVPVDNSGKALIATPSRDGGTRPDELAVPDTEEEMSEEEEV